MDLFAEFDPDIYNLIKKYPNQYFNIRRGQTVSSVNSSKNCPGRNIKSEALNASIDS